MIAGKLILIDGHALLHRAFHALPPTFTSPSGELTNATFGFTSMLLNVLAQEKPEYIAITFDVGRTFRHDQYEPYKAQRTKAPEELTLQMKRVKEVVEAFNIPSYEMEGYEADDLLGTLAKQASQQGVETVIVTGDMDTFQLIAPKVKVLVYRGRSSDTVLYDEARIQERYGLSPKQLIDFKGLTGDSSDNIPGVPGVGPKTATTLLREYENLEEVYDHLGEIKGKRARRALTENKELAFLSRELGTIVTDVPIALDLEACRASDYDRARVMEIFRELGFRSLVDRLPPTSQELSPSERSLEEQVETDYRIVSTEAQLDALLEELKEARRFAFDAETTSKDAMVADLVGLSFSAERGRAYYIPVGHRALGQTIPQLPLDYVLEGLRPILEDEGLQKYAHNGKYDLTILARHGVLVKGLVFDTMIAAWLLNPSSRGLNLKDLAWRKLGVEMRPISDLIGRGRKQITMAQVPIADASRYSCADSDMTYRLVEVFEAELRERELYQLFHQVEMPLVPILMRMEMKGVALDVEFLGQMSRELYQQIAQLEGEIHELAGYRFNINSTQQLSSLLFKELELTPIERTKTGYSTSARVLEQLRGEHPIIEHILRYRELTKLKSTYVDALPLLVNRETGRVHTSYNQTGTVTGRVSSSDPNLQNIPIRSELGRRIRRAFVAEEGNILLGVDYSQIDLRVLAHISSEPNLVSAFQRGEDIHSSTAAAIYDVSLEDVTPEMRSRAKTVNFAIVYGVTDYGLAQQSDLSREEAADFIESYFSLYPGVKDYMERTKAEAREAGFVSTLLGHRRYFPELKSGERISHTAIRAAERMAINAPVQGSAADIIKLAMIELDGAIRERNLQGQMILQVHDELVFEVPEGEIEVMKPLVRSIMEGVMELDVPLKVDIKLGRDWEEME